MTRSIFLRLFLVSVVLFLGIFITNQKIFGENWIPMGDPENGTAYFFDEDSITEVHPSIKRVWTKIIVPIEVMLKFRENAGLPFIDFSSYSYTIHLCEINCKNQSFGVLIAVDFDKNETAIDSAKYNPQIDFIISGSMGELLYKDICP